MRKIQRIILLLCIVICGQVNKVDSASNPPQHSDLTNATLRFQNISLEQGLSQSVVLDIEQDQRGFLWVATEDGLNRYNGYTFDIFRHDPAEEASLANNYVRTLYVDRAGVLWVGTDSGLDRFEPATNDFMHYTHNPEDAQSLGGKEINAITEDAAGCLWVGTSDGGLSCLDRDTGHFKNYLHESSNPQSLSNNNVSALATCQNGSLWIGTDNGIDRYDQETNTFRHYRPNPQGSNAVRTIYEDRDGILWFGIDEGGVARFDPVTESFTLYQHDPDDRYSLSNNTVLAIYQDHKNLLWFGTQNGLHVWNNERQKFMRVLANPDDPRSLSSETIHSIYQDRSGVLWFGTYGGGLCKLTHAASNFLLYQQNANNPNTLSDNHIWSIASTQDGSVWVGTMFAGLNRMNREIGTVQKYVHIPGETNSLSHNDVRALYLDRTGLLWIGTYGGGLDQLDPKTGVFINHHHDSVNPDSLAENQIRVIHEDRNGNLWIGTQSRGVDVYNRSDKTFTHLRYDPNAPTKSLSSDRIRSIQEDREGRIWLGAWNAGLNILNPDTNELIQYHYNPDIPGSLPNETILDLHEDAQGRMWVATYGGGLARFNAETGTFHAYTTKEGLPNDGVYAIEEDAQGYLWISTNMGLARFDPNSETVTNFNINDGLQSNEFNYGASHCATWGECFFGGINGLNAFYPDQVQENPHIPPVIITDFRKQNQSIFTNLTPDQQIQLSYHDNFISFEFAALDYNAPEEQRYAYMLEGQDDDWIDAGTRRHADYTNLKGGQYVFRVIASNNDGVWNTEGASVHMSITPPLWETWTFRIASMLFLASVLIGGYRWRMHTVQTRSLELEQEVEKRTAEIEQRRKELEALYQADEELFKHMNLDQILQELVHIAVDILNADKSSLLAWDDSHEKLIVRAAQGFAEKTLSQMTFTPTEGIVGLVATSGMPVIVEDTRLDPRVLRRITEPESIRAFMDMPIQVGNQIFGVFNVDYTQPRMFTRDVQRLFMALAQRAALVIENAQLYEQTEQMAISSERNRIARELHDSVSQALYGIALGSRTARTLLERQPVDDSVKTALANPLDYVLSLADAGLAEMRALIFELRPDALEKEGLAAALTKHAEAIHTRHKMNVKIEICDEIPDMPLSTKEALYRVAQEAINNLIKHAQADLVYIRLRCEQSKIVLEVEDNGVGFDPDIEYHGHMGLHTMRERMVRLGGTLHIDSTEGKGTIVRAQIPT